MSEVITKRRAPTSPKPRVARPVPRRNLKTQNKVSAMEDLYAHVVVDDLIQSAIKEDVKAVQDDIVLLDSEDEMMDDALSISGDSDEEEVESFNLVCQVAKRVVKQSLGQNEDEERDVEMTSEIAMQPFDFLLAQARTGQLFATVRALALAEESEDETEEEPVARTEPIQAPQKQLVQEPSAQPQANPRQETTPFHLQPSVGTWMAPRPVPVQKPSVQPQANAKQDTTPFHLQPSVGTWMAPRPVPVQKPSVQPQTDAKEETTPFHLQPSVGTWMAPRPVPVQKPSAQPQGNRTNALARAEPTAVCLKPAAATEKNTKTKRRILGAVPVIAPEALPTKPSPPSAPTKRPNWFMAGSVSNGLRQREVQTYHLADEEPRGLQRKSSLAAMFETMGSAELIRMDADEVPINSASAMAIDLGWDLSAKKESRMGPRCSSLGSLPKLAPLQKGKLMDWSVSNSINSNHSWLNTPLGK